MVYNRILLKLSGEALLGGRSHGIDPKTINKYSDEIKSIVDLGVEVSIVIGGGNIFRGLSGANNGIDRVQGDYMGMLATRNQSTKSTDCIYIPPFFKIFFHFFLLSFN